MFNKIIATVSTGAPQGIYPQQVQQGDFNGDGIADLALVFSSGRGEQKQPILFFLGQGNGSFLPATDQLFGANKPYADYAARVVAADFNSDGRTDVFVPDFGLDAPPFPGGQSYLIASAPGGKMSIGTAGIPQETLQSHGAAIGDVNGDGAADVVLFNVNEPGRGLSLLLGNGQGGFADAKDKLPNYYQGTSGAEGSTWGGLVDVNRDGKLDLIVGLWTNSKGPSAVYLNDGTGNFKNAVPIALPGTSVARPSVMDVDGIDLNGDGATDLIVSLTNSVDGDVANYYTAGYMQFLINDGTGHFRDETAERLPQTTAPVGGWVKFVQLGDVNGDGHKDLIVDWWINNKPPETRFYLNDGAGHFQKLDAAIVGEGTPILDASGRMAAFATLEFGANGIFEIRTIENDALGLPTPSIRTADSSSVPAATAYRFFVGGTPSAEKLDSLSNFAYEQFLAYKAQGVSRPAIGPYEALGRGYSETDAFKTKYGALAGDAFVSASYGDVFGRQATAAQTDHFKAQISYFDSLYQGAGIPASTAGLLAKGAVVGQMLGFATLDEPVRTVASVSSVMGELI